VTAEMEPFVIDPYPGFDFHTLICLANPSSNITEMNDYFALIYSRLNTFNSRNRPQDMENRTSRSLSRT
jgi:hypothetical protein